MQNLFNAAVYNNIISRINGKKWGKMNVAQMLAHCKGPVKVSLADKKMPRMLMGILIGWMIKPKLYNDSPWKQSLPTAADFIIKDEKDFEKEKQELPGLLNKFYTARLTGVGKFPHPMFGKFTPDQWGMSLYKHMDHHLQQFGV